MLWIFYRLHINRIKWTRVDIELIDAELTSLTLSQVNADGDMRSTQHAPTVVVSERGAPDLRVENSVVSYSNATVSIHSEGQYKSNRWGMATATVWWGWLKTWHNEDKCEDLFILVYPEAPSESSKSWFLEKVTEWARKHSLVHLSTHTFKIIPLLYTNTWVKDSVNSF